MTHSTPSAPIRPNPPRQVTPLSEASALDRLRLQLTVSQAGVVEAVDAGASRAVFGFPPQARTRPPPLGFRVQGLGSGSYYIYHTTL